MKKAILILVITFILLGSFQIATYSKCIDSVVPNEDVYFTPYSKDKALTLKINLDESLVGARYSINWKKVKSASPSETIAWDVDEITITKEETVDAGYTWIIATVTVYGTDSNGNGYVADEEDYDWVIGSIFANYPEDLPYWYDNQGDYYLAGYTRDINTEFKYSYQPTQVVDKGEIETRFIKNRHRDYIGSPEVSIYKFLINQESYVFQNRYNIPFNDTYNSDDKTSFPIDKWTHIHVETMYNTTLYDASGNLVSIKVKNLSDTYGSYIKFTDHTPNLSDSPTIANVYALSDKPVKFTASSEDIAGTVQWFVDGVESESEPTIRPKGNQCVSRITYRIDEKTNADEPYVLPQDGNDWKYYVVDYRYINWSFSKADLKTVPPVDLYSCAAPYSLGDGVTTDLRTGDVKIRQTDLVLPGRGGSNLVLSRVLSTRLNVRKSTWWFRFLGMYCSYEVMMTDINNPNTFYEQMNDPWVGSFPTFFNLKEEPSKSILTEPMPGWTYDLPRITPLYIYCDGKLYPNCLEADRRNWGARVHFFWPQGCEKKNGMYYFRDGNFRVSQQGTSVVLTKADGTSYVFPCHEDNTTGGWAYSPLAQIRDKTGNNVINFTYGENTVTITDSVGRIIEVNQSGVTVNGITVTSFDVQYGSQSWVPYTSSTVTDSMIYSSTDILGRTQSVSLDLYGVKVTSALGNEINLSFDELSCGLDDQSNTYHDDTGLVCVGGNYNGRDLSVKYVTRDDGLIIDPIASWTKNYDTITSTVITDGSESYSAHFEYSGLSFADSGQLYNLATPGPDNIINGCKVAVYHYEQHDAEYDGQTTPINNKLYLLSSLDYTQGTSSYTRSFEYDGDYRVRHVSGPEGVSDYTYFQIDSDTNYFTGLAVIAKGNVVTINNYNGSGLLSSVSLGDAPPTVYNYDSFGNVTEVIDPKGNSTTISYDPVFSMLPDTITAGERSESYTYYYPFGWVKSHKFGPYETNYTYDAAGRTQTVTDATGTTTTSYNDSGHSIKTTDTDGNTSESVYDKLGRTITSTSTDGIGNQITSESYTYDPQHDWELIKTIQDGIGSLTNTYDETSNSETVIDANGNTSVTQYDLVGRVIKNDSSNVTEDGGTPTTQTSTYEYDPNSGLLSVVHEPGRTVTTQYNNRGLIERNLYSDGKEETYQYDANCNPELVKTRGGRIFNYQYDRFNEVTQVLVGNEVIASFTYDNLGRIETEGNGDTLYHNYYDDQGLLQHSERTIRGRMYDLWYGYGNSNRLTSMTIKDIQGNVLTAFGYDYSPAKMNDGNPSSTKTSVSALVNGNMVLFGSQVTGEGGRLSSATYGNGLVQSYQYDNRQRLTGTSISSANNPTVTHTYGFGSSGNITSIDGQSFTYDGYGRLKTATGGLKDVSYDYDDHGNRLLQTKAGRTTTYTYENGLLTKAGSTTYTYNPDGSLSIKTLGNDHWNYTYDNLGQLTSVRKNDNDILGSYGYDIEGWRIWKEENGKTSIYIRDGKDVLYQEVFAGEPTTTAIPEKTLSFVYLNGDLIGSVANGSEAHYFLNDHLGTTEVVTDNQGNVLKQIQHTPFSDEVLVKSSSKQEKILDSNTVDLGATTAVVINGQATTTTSDYNTNILIHQDNKAVDTNDPHFASAKEFVFDYNDPNVLQLKVVSGFKYGDNETVEYTDIIDLTGKQLGKYKIILDMRKDIGGANPTENTKFEVYESRLHGPIQSVVQTQPILLDDGTKSIVLTPEGTGLENVTWDYSGDGGHTWVSVTPGTSVQLLSDTHYVLVRATLNLGASQTTVTGFGLSAEVEKNCDEDYLFTGKERDATGLYYFGARYYDPETGRFISEDPALDGENWYGYCGNDPVNYYDPDGQEKRDIAQETFLRWTLSDPYSRLGHVSYADKLLTTLYFMHDIQKIDVSKLSIKDLDQIYLNEKRGWDFYYSVMTPFILIKGLNERYARNIISSPKGLIGKDFEGWLQEYYEGRGSFKYMGREFDGAHGNIWYEAKSGRYWQDIVSSPEGFSKFRSDMGQRLSIARESGARLELYSNTPIPEYVKEWLIKKGIRFLEFL